MTKVEFRAKTHQYFIDDELYPSVTQILSILDKPALIYWASNITADYILSNIDKIKNSGNSYSGVFTAAKKEHQLIKEKAADIGTQTHRLIENYLKHRPFEKLITKETEKSWIGFGRWFGNKKFRLIDSERIVWSKKYRVAGTVDVIGNIDGKNYLLDLKTSKAIYPEMLLQISAYRNMYEEVTNTKIQKLAILRLDKLSGNFEWKEYSQKEYQKALKMFILLSKYWHLKNDR